MRIAHCGLGIADGKCKYQDAAYLALVEKFQPAKLSPYVFEFKAGDFENAQAVAIAADRVLDLLVPDMERLEGRIERAGSDDERAMLARCLAHLESGHPLCDLELDEAARATVRTFGLLSLKPTAVLADASADASAVCAAVIRKAGMMFFFTVGKPEVHAWLVERNADAVTCAGRIHTDLARGFIKAEIFRFEDILAAHSVQDARSRGLVRLVDRDVPVPPDSILEIRFKV
jgi:ribosome-binding ATPase YchF (GTP1/OBG family)